MAYWMAVLFVEQLFQFLLGGFGSVGKCVPGDALLRMPHFTGRRGVIQMEIGKQYIYIYKCIYREREIIEYDAYIYTDAVM